MRFFDKLREEVRLATGWGEAVIDGLAQAQATEAQVAEVPTPLPGRFWPVDAEAHDAAYRPIQSLRVVPSRGRVLRKDGVDLVPWLPKVSALAEQPGA